MVPKFGTSLAPLPGKKECSLKKTIMYRNKAHLNPDLLIKEREWHWLRIAKHWLCQIKIDRFTINSWWCA